MEAKNFRIGNFVKDRGNKVIRIDFMEYQEIGYSTKIGQRMFLGEEEVHPMTEYTDYVIPIELTKEWLIKFGFTEGNKCYKNAYSLEVLKTDFYLRPSYQDEFYWGFNISDEKLDCELNDVKPLKYVHELQNLFFAITGTELELKHERSTCG